MFINYYKLSEQPFGVTSDPRFLYLGIKHREALASLNYGTESDRGLLAMIAEPGMGKTSLVYEYLSHLGPQTRTAFLFKTDCDSRELMQQALVDLGIDVAGMDLPKMYGTLNQFLIEEMQAGRRVVLVIDEAQNLDEKSLESIRLLSNFETPSAKLLLIILAGQPDLASRLAAPSLSQLRQRISMVIRIEPFTHEEVNAYIDHRLSVAGGTNQSLFTVGARKLIAEHSDGIPRNINNICFNAMSLGCALRQETIDRDTISAAIADLDLAPLKRKTRLIPDPDFASLKKESNANAELSHAASKTRSFSIVNHNAVWPETKTVVAETLIAKSMQQDVPKRSGTGNRRSIPGGWGARVAIASIFVLTLAGSTHQGQRVSFRVTDSRKIIAPIVPPAKSTSAAADNALRSGGLSRNSIRILPGQTLYAISIKEIGKYNHRIVRDLRELNPWLNDPNLIRSGENLLIPLPKIASAFVVTKTGRADISVSSGAVTQ